MYLSTINTHTQTHTHTHTQTHTYTHTHTHVYTYVHTYIHIIGEAKVSFSNGKEYHGEVSVEEEEEAFHDPGIDFFIFFRRGTSIIFQR
jgi:hypothetical protein